MNTQTYYCRCGCGRTFTSAYATTALCPACCLLFLADSHQPAEDDNLYSAAGFLLTQPFYPGGLSQRQFYRPGRTGTAALILVGAVLFALLVLGYAGAMGQANLGGWEQ